MRSFLISFLLFIAFAPQSASQQIVPLIEKSAFRDDLVWNKWDTTNFTVLSLDKTQGLLLKDSLEKMRESILESWGLPSGDSLVRCKLVCVPDRKTLGKLFNIESPRFEVRHSSDGKVSVCAIWIDNESLHVLPSLVASVCVSDSLSTAKISPVLQNGIVALSVSPKRTREILGKHLAVDSKAVFGMTGEAWSAAKDKETINGKCALICLMLRKEFGREAFSHFVTSAQNEDSIRLIFGFDGYKEMTKTLDRYSANLAEDIKNGQTPDGYLVP